LLEYAQADKNFFKINVISDETWVYSYDPKTKQLSSQCKMSSSSAQCNKMHEVWC
jgi:hypothetical protein